MKHFVLDTNVLLHDPRAILQFADNEVVIPIFVLEEVDQFKKEASERGRNAREVARLLDALRANGARLSDGVPLPESPFVACSSVKFPLAGSSSSARAAPVASNVIVNSDASRVFERMTDPP